MKLVQYIVVRVIVIVAVQLLILSVLQYCPVDMQLIGLLLASITLGAAGGFLRAVVGTGKYAFWIYFVSSFTAMIIFAVVFNTTGRHPGQLPSLENDVMTTLCIIGVPYVILSCGAFWIGRCLVSKMQTLRSRK